MTTTTTATTATTATTITTATTNAFITIIITILSFVMNVFLNYFLAFYLGYGHVGLALGSSIAAIVSVVIYYLILSRNSFIEVTRERFIFINS